MFRSALAASFNNIAIIQRDMSKRVEAAGIVAQRPYDSGKAGTRASVGTRVLD